MVSYVRFRPPVPAIVLSPLVALEGRAVALLSRIAVPLLRLSMGLVFIWFGALKVAGTTPVADLVAATVPMFDRSWFVPALGLIEVVFGLALVIGRPLRLILPMLVAHLAGTFLVLVDRPDLAFQHGNPFLLTTIGEFVVKNVVLIAGALALASRLTPTTKEGGQGRPASMKK
jgi:uncharacterized membrane protein YkgB